MPDIIDRALMGHAQIKKRLCEAIRNPDTADLDDIRSDQTCAFGQWIYGPEGVRNSGLPQFRTLRDIHARFHEAAYQAALAAQAGRLREAEISIVSGDFEMSSRAMTQALIDLKAARIPARLSLSDTVF